MPGLILIPIPYIEALQYITSEDIRRVAQLFFMIKKHLYKKMEEKLKNLWAVENCSQLRLDLCKFGPS